MTFGKLRYELSSKPKYCKKCGAEIERFTCPNGYDVVTGKATRMFVSYSCPNNNPFDYHYGYSWNEDVTVDE